MIALGALSYWLVEQRLTRWIFRPQTRRWRLAAVAFATLLALVVISIPTHGLEALRTLGAAPQVRAAMADDRRATRDWAYPQVCSRHSAKGQLEFCQLGDPAARQVLLIGDSHAQELAPRYVHAFDGRPGTGLTLVTVSGCIPIPGVSGRGARGCGALWRTAYDYADTAGFKRVAIIAAWPLYFDPTDTSPLGLAWIDGPAAQPPTLGAIAAAAYQRLEGEVRRLQARGAEVVLIGQTPRSADGDPHALYARAFWRGELGVPPLSRATLEASLAPDRDRLARVAQTTGAELADPLDGLCDGDACPLVQNGRALFRDHGHYRASVMTSARFAIFDRWLAPQTAPIPAAMPAPIRLK
jgi:hypothetical protein